MHVLCLIQIKIHIEKPFLWFLVMIINMHSWAKPLIKLGSFFLIRHYVDKYVSSTFFGVSDNVRAGRFCGAKVAGTAKFDFCPLDFQHFALLAMFSFNHILNFVHMFPVLSDLCSHVQPHSRNLTGWGPKEIICCSSARKKEQAGSITCPSASKHPL